MAASDDDRPSPEEYRTFVRRLELADARLVGCDVSAQALIEDPSRVVLDLNQETAFNVFEGGFEAVQEYQFYFLDRKTEDELGQIDVAFGFVYETDQPTGAADLDRYLEVFRFVSLPVNVWPFAREFVHNMTMRLGWPRLDLPLLKPGMDEKTGMDEGDGSSLIEAPTDGTDER